MKLIRNSLFSLLCSITAFSSAQYEPLARNIPINRDLINVIDEWDLKKGTLSFHSAFKPYWSKTLLNYSDSFCNYAHYPVHNFFLSKTFNDAPDKRNQYNVQLHPVLDAQTGYDLLTNRVIVQTGGGAHIKLNVNNDFTFAGTIYGARTQLPFFLDTQVVQTKLIPDYEQAYAAGKNTYALFDYSGYISYSPQQNRFFNFQLGKDKHFIGDGYRSVLLSDYAANYPYFRINANIWHIQYHAWYTLMYDLSNANGIKRNFQNKFGTFHYLSWNIIPQLQIGLFENIIWQGTDSNRVRGFEVNYLNPIIFFRPQEYAVGSPDNAFIGLNVNAKLFRTVKLYGQLGLDEFFLKEIRARNGWWANKQAWQLGFKYFNAFHVPHLTLQAEYNEARPYTYSHGAVAQNYAHYGQALAHPFGANFKEYIGSINFQLNRWQINMQVMYAILGRDSSANQNLGQNIFLSYTTRPYDFGHKTTQGLKQTILQSDVRLSYFLIPQLNLKLELGYIQRNENFTQRYLLQNPYLYVGIRSSLWNTYRDF